MCAYCMFADENDLTICEWCNFDTQVAGLTGSKEHAGLLILLQCIKWNLKADQEQTQSKLI